jgi:hypothetical protein
LRYLLVGNAPDCSDAVLKSAQHAEAIVQLNKCAYAEILPPDRTNYIVITNSGQVSEWLSIVDRVASVITMPAFRNARVVFARNPLFYTLKKHAIRARGNPMWEFYRINRLQEDRCSNWPLETSSFASTLRLEWKLLRLGMRKSSMPSTGMIAYHWLRERVTNTDAIILEAFTFHGWHIHPWPIEKQLVRPITPP